MELINEKLGWEALKPPDKLSIGGLKNLKEKSMKMTKTKLKGFSFAHLAGLTNKKSRAEEEAEKKAIAKNWDHLLAKASGNKKGKKTA